MKRLLRVIKLQHTDANLINKAIENKREAQHLLFERYSPKMLSVCRYYIRDIHKAEEIMVDGFLKAFTRLKQYKGSGNFEGWLRRIMVNESINYLKSKKPMEVLTNAITEYEKVADQEYTAVDTERIQHVIDQLPAGYRTVFLLYAIEGYGHEEIAKKLDISVGTSKSQLHKARKQLQDAVNEMKNKRYGTE